MNTFEYILAYHFDNHTVASEIDLKLNRVGFYFEHIHSGNALVDQSLGQRLSEKNKYFFLLISENFLKDVNCLYKLFESILIAEKQNRKFCIILIKGNLIDPLSGQLKEVETKLNSVGDLLYYINYWQDQYLTLRKKYLEEEQSLQTADGKLKKIREIASEIGELLHKIRNLNPISIGKFQENQYKYFFEITNHSEAYESYIQMSSFDDKDDMIERKVEELLKQKQNEASAEGEKVNFTEKNTDEKASFESGKSHSIRKETEESILLEKLLNYKKELIDEAEQPTQKSTSDRVEKKAEQIKNVEHEAMADFDDIEKLDKELSAKMGQLLNEKFKIMPVDESADDEAFRLQNDKQKTISTLRKAALAQPESTEVRLELVRLLMDDPDNFSEVTDLLESILKLDRDNIDAIYLIGKISESVGEYNLAKTYFTKLANLQADFPNIHYDLAQLLMKHFPAEVEEASFYLKKTFQHDTTNTKALEQRGILLYKSLNKPQKAKKIFEKLIKWNPEHPTAYYHLAEIYYNEGDNDQAVENFKMAKSITAKLTNQPTKEVEIEQKSESLIQKFKPELSTDSESIIPAPKKISSFVMITGASSGIGKATAELLAAKGKNLILTGRRSDRLEQLASDLKQSHAIDVEILVFDVRDFSSIQKAIDTLGDKIEGVDVLINNAGLALGFDPIFEGSVDHWDTMIDTNVKGVLYMTRLITPGMVKRKKGHIVNICSTAGKEVYPKGNVYCATKFAVEALTRAFRQDLLPYNIRVSEVSPGHTEHTEFAQVRFEGDKERAKIYNDFNPLRSEDVASIIDFILHQPPHVNIQDVLVTATQQASSTLIDRSGRNFD